MAIATATCTCATCGATFYMEKTCATRSMANSWEEWAAAHYDECDECTAKRRVDAAAEQAKKDSENGVPAFTHGTEKQITWATQIRGEFLESNSAQMIARHCGKNEELKETFLAFAAWILKTKTSAHWWIENRGLQSGYIALSRKYLILKDEFEAYREQQKNAEQIANPETESANEAVSEAMVKPDAETTKVPAEIVVTEKDIRIPYEKDSGFIDVMHKLGWEWSRDDMVWHKFITVVTGNVIDRVAEAGNALLHAGYPVVIWDAEAREKAVNGHFTRECKRWILRHDENTLKAIWEKGNEKLYRELRKISGAQYVDGTIHFPLRQWRSILDIAENSGFSVTEKARVAIDRQKEMEDNAVIRKPAAAAASEPLTDDGIKSILKSSDAVLPDLKDD